MSRKLRIEAVITDTATHPLVEIMAILAQYQSMVGQDIEYFTVSVVPIVEPIDGTATTTQTPIPFEGRKGAKAQ